MNVTAVSWRAQRGLALDCADVRVSNRRAPVAASTITTSPPSSREHAFVRAIEAPGDRRVERARFVGGELAQSGCRRD